MERHRTDVIVVGAGSAGCALARRLSDDPGISVALLEAGGERLQPRHRHALDVLQALGHARSTGPTSRCRSPARDEPHPPAPARPGARRHERDQRHGLPARRGRRLRRLGGSGARLGLGRRPRRLRGARGRCLRPRSSTRRNELSEVFLDAARGGRPSAAQPVRRAATSTAAGGTARASTPGERHSSYRAFVHPVLRPPEPHAPHGDDGRAADRRPRSASSAASRCCDARHRASR